MSCGYTLREMVLRSFLRNPKMGPSEMAEHLQAKYNSVKAIFSKLYEEGLLVREGRGNYSPNVTGIMLHLMDRIERIESGED